MSRYSKANGTRVRTVAIGEVAQAGRAQEEQAIHVHHLSYFSRMTDADTFAELAEVEMRATWGKPSKSGVCGNQWSRLGAKFPGSASA